MTILEPDTLRGGLAVIEVAFQSHEKGCTTDYDITIYGQFEMRINVDGCCVRGCGHTTCPPPSLVVRPHRPLPAGRA